LTPLSILLILVSALLHSSWNFFTKRGNWPLEFFFWVFLSGFLLPIPFLAASGAVSALIDSMGPELLWIMAASGLFETIYFACLIGAYQVGDLSLVYPISRAAPLFTQIWAVVFIGEVLSVPGALGIGLVMGGIFVVSIRGFRSEVPGKGWRAQAPPVQPGPIVPQKGRQSYLPYILALVAAIASSLYSVLDKVGVRMLHPVLYLWIINFWMALDTGIYLVMRGRNPLRVLRQSGKEILLITLFQNGAYLLVLIALTMSKVSYVVAFRQVGVLLGAGMGILFLKEQHGKVRLAGALILSLGLLLIGFAK
jgi:drug/metabolite transporter (DMT)-like permease